MQLPSSAAVGAVCEHQVRDGMLTMTLTQSRSLVRRGPLSALVIMRKTLSACQTQPSCQVSLAWHCDSSGALQAVRTP